MEFNKLKQFKLRHGIICDNETLNHEVYIYLPEFTISKFLELLISKQLFEDSESHKSEVNVQREISRTKYKKREEDRTKSLRYPATSAAMLADFDFPLSEPDKSIFDKYESNWYKFKKIYIIESPNDLKMTNIKFQQDKYVIINNNLNSFVDFANNSKLLNSFLSKSTNEQLSKIKNILMSIINDKKADFDDEAVKLTLILIQTEIDNILESKQKTDADIKFNKAQKRSTILSSISICVAVLSVLATILVSIYK